MRKPRPPTQSERGRAASPGFSGQLAKNDPQIRTLLERAPGAFDEASRLLDQIKPTLPVLLANLTTIGQIGVTYHASLEQVLVLLPPFTAAIQSFLGTKSPTGLATGAFNLIVSDPPACTVGFLPPSQWRAPADTRTVDTPDGLYCKLPQDSPIGVRGARNYPCQGQPGKRAPTVEICESDKPFEPLAMRQHVFGTYPLDPNLIAQGIPPDDRVNWNRERIFGPVEGTPLPPGAVPRGTPPSGGPPPSPAPLNPAAQMGEVSPIAPIDIPAPAGAPDRAAPGAPCAVQWRRVRSKAMRARPGPSVAVAQYDPHTGSYVAPDGQVYRQSDLVAQARRRKRGRTCSPREAERRPQGRNVSPGRVGSADLVQPERLIDIQRGVGAADADGAGRVFPPGQNWRPQRVFTGVGVRGIEIDVVRDRGMRCRRDRFPSSGCRALTYQFSPSCICIGALQPWSLTTSPCAVLGGGARRGDLPRASHHRLLVIHLVGPGPVADHRGGVCPVDGGVVGPC